MSVLVTSFFTPNGDYPDHALRLGSECEALGLDCEITERPDLGDYLANCRQKPAHIMEVLERHDRPVLWVDVDASILRTPPPIRPVDFAAVRMPEHRDRVWHVATLYFRPTEGAFGLLRLWLDALTDGASDEAALDDAWHAWTGTYADLGPDYMNVENRRTTPDPVVMHRLSRSPRKHEALSKLREAS